MRQSNLKAQCAQCVYWLTFIGVLLPLNVDAQIATSLSDVPYVAYVATRGTSLASGPGFKYYSTDRLGQGSKVEVYKHENEWAAIRPPKGSFSWVPANAVTTTDNPAVVRVTQAGVRPRIGTRYSTKRDQESVAMRQGELLEILGEQQFTDGKGTLATWYKIAPPPGEFRWIRAAALSNSPPEKEDVSDLAVADADEQKTALPGDSEVIAATFDLPVESDNDPVAETTLELGPPDGSVVPADERLAQSIPPPTSGITTVVPLDKTERATAHIPSYDIVAKKSSAKIQQAQWSYDLAPRTGSDMFHRQSSAPPAYQSVGQNAGSPWREVNGFQPIQRVANNAPLLLGRNRLPGAAPKQNAATSGAPAAPRISATSPVATAPVPPCGPARSQLWLMQQELMDIDLRLAQTVTQPPAGWSLAMLRARTQAMIDASQVAAVRDEAQRILAKIAQFEDVQRRSRRVNQSEMAIAATMPPGGMLPTSAAAGSWLANVSPEYFDSSSAMVGTFESEPYTGYESYASGFPGSYDSGYASDGYIPGPGETIIADRRADEVGEPTLASRSSEPRMASSSRGNYDGKGWLMPVVTDRSDMPRYVLTDSKGNVKQFVTPQPGLNLKRYLRKEIAIYGQERFIDDLKRPHLTAERVISLDTKVR